MSTKSERKDKNKNPFVNASAVMVHSSQIFQVNLQRLEQEWPIERTYLVATNGLYRGS